MIQFTLLNEARFEWNVVQQILLTDFAVRDQPSQKVHRYGATDKRTCSSIAMLRRLEHVAEKWVTENLQFV